MQRSDLWCNPETNTQVPSLVISGFSGMLPVHRKKVTPPAEVAPSPVEPTLASTVVEPTPVLPEPIRLSPTSENMPLKAATSCGKVGRPQRLSSNSEKSRWRG